MKNNEVNIKDKIVSKYFAKNTSFDQPKSTNVNVLLNRVRDNQKNETRKKLYFSAAASTCLILFGIVIF